MWAGTPSAAGEKNGGGEGKQLHLIKQYCCTVAAGGKSKPAD